MKAFKVLCFFFALTVLLSCNRECENENGECPEEQLQKDLALIENYLEENNLEAESTASGLHYVITQQGNDTTANVGQTVEVNYTGRFLDGTVFDTSIESVAEEAGIVVEGRDYKPIQFRVGTGMVIAGWDEAFFLLDQGSKAILLIPSQIAYGPSGRAQIPANTVLMFEVELLDIKF